jgi:Ca2+/Na+ antiporter
MELDNLKELWRDMGQKYVHQNTDEQIVIMLQRRSQSPIARMKRNLLFELVAVILLYSPGIVYFMATWNARYWELAVLLLVVGLLFIFYYYRKNRLLSEMQCVTCEVRSNLQKQLTTLEKYVQFYFVSGTVLTPVAYFSSALVVLFKSPALDDAITNKATYVIIVGIGLVVTIGSYFLNKWYVKKLYGQHIKKLKALLQQMEEQEPHS